MKHINKKNKIFIVSLFLFIGVLGGLFAAGQSEYPAVPYGPRGGYAFQTPWEKITVTGEIYFVDKLHPEIKSGGKEYELLIPRFLYYGIDVKEGDEVTVEGYEVPAPYHEMVYGEEGDEIHLMVTKADINGKEYDLSRTENYGYGYGPMMGGAMMGHPGYGGRFGGRRW